MPTSKQPGRPTPGSRLVHVITPGDHFSPLTGSAIPTVVHGLCASRPQGQPRPAVVVARSTYADRYDSADIVEYDERSPLRLGPIKERHLDAALSVVGLPRLASRRALAATVASQSEWAPSVILAHNAPQLIPVIDHSSHVAVLYAHNQLLRTYRPAEARRGLSSATAIVCVSDALANQTSERLPPDLRRLLRVVRNGVDVEAFRRSGPLERTGPLRVVFVGRMIPDKGADVLVEAVKRMGRTDIDLTLVGSSGFSPTDPLTPYERSVREAVAPLGERARVRAFVPRAEVSAVMQEADVVVVPSRWPEPFALSVLEGMAAGAAVVGSAIGGIPETVRDVGILVTPGDSGELAEVLEALAADETYRQQVVRACLAYAESHSWARTSAELYAIVGGLR